VSLGMPINVVSDVASFLWRLHAYGHAVPTALWEAAASYAETAFPTAGFPFADVHMALLAAATGDRAGIERRAASLTALVEAGKLAAGPAVPAICRGFLAFAEADYAGCVGILQPVAGEVARIGGSGAQREIVEDTLLLALMRSGEAAKARALLDRRLHRRPSPRDTIGSLPSSIGVGSRTRCSRRRRSRPAHPDRRFVSRRERGGMRRA
jgi:hypothetical protein